jgi:hypothetical protein
MKARTLLIVLTVMSGIVIALPEEHVNPERPQPEHKYGHAQKNDSEIQSDMYYQRLEQERSKQHLLERQRKEQKRLKQQRQELQMENQRKSMQGYDYNRYDDSRMQSDTDYQRLKRQRIDQLRIEQRQLELQQKNQRIQNEMEKERQEQIIREFYH